MDGPLISPHPVVGPRGLPLLGSLTTFGRDPQSFLVRLREEYGDIVQWFLGSRRCVLLSHPEHIASVLRAAGDRFEPADMGWAVNQIATGSVGLAQGEDWRRKRAIVQPVVRPRRVREYAAATAACAATQVTAWQEGDRIDVQREMTRVTGHIVARTLFGDAPQVHSQALHQAMATMQSELAAQVRGGLTLFMPGWMPTPSRRRLLAARKVIDSTIDQLILQHHAHPHRDDGHAVLNTLLDHRDEKGEALSSTEVRNEAVALWIGGHETTASALTWTWLALSRTPHARLRLTEELEQVLSGRSPSYDDYDRLPYTRKVVQEGLRLYPPFWTLVMTAVRDTVIGGIEVPAQTLVWCSPWSTHRDSRWFTDPLAFRPERWDTPAHLTSQAWFPFGAGSRACLGARFAQVESVLLLATQAQRFHLDIDSGPVAFQCGPFLQPSRPLLATVRIPTRGITPREGSI